MLHVKKHLSRVTSAIKLKIHRNITNQNYLS